MSRLEIILGRSVGDINIGMKRSEVREMLGDYREFKIDAEGMNTFDQFSEFNIGYDENDQVNFISIHLPNNFKIEFNGKIISEMSSLELFSFIKDLDSNVELEPGYQHFNSNVLGFAASFKKTSVLLLDTEEKRVCEVLESITVAVRDYWKLN
jgi:hypothetical protein